MGKSPFETIFQKVPYKYVDELLGISSTHTVGTQMIERVEWQYLLSGHGKGIITLGGAMSTADNSRSLIQSLGKDCSVRVPVIKHIHI